MIISINLQLLQKKCDNIIIILWVLKQFVFIYKIKTVKNVLWKTTYVTLM